jgi:hypothetical protein
LALAEVRGLLTAGATRVCGAAGAQAARVNTATIPMAQRTPRMWSSVRARAEHLRATAALQASDLAATEVNVA